MTLGVWEVAKSRVERDNSHIDEKALIYKICMDGLQMSNFSIFGGNS